MTPQALALWLRLSERDYDAGEEHTAAMRWGFRLVLVSLAGVILGGILVVGLVVGGATPEPTPSWTDVQLPTE